ncbi:uncharacterized protein SPSK_04343 [Sporothrix schenckii 1099-18]|uniref:AB hydrolase-1 domain-containing protein n=2 Tax=Sporothrix schenckii TaxID=29908 RepID=U7PWV2_SPOS1|nr:uncharacterized protein SPSK_04343 [Sporothrix schenckii 1099-18]ERS99386.1 hypothetical protein HMPREF1624_04586 [Sporothrix schenckii ATCC 58251]KJR82895.1 hypothetical protein SPSK_04343 [Sporothrix schenckii 1099-18]
MAHTTNPMPDLPPPPPVSRRTIPVAGLLVDFYGLDELPADTESVSVLWLHHPRLRSREDMADIGARCVQAVADESATTRTKHRLVAAAFDQRNHGSRLVSPRANTAWREGNTTHAQDMFGMIAGTVSDTHLLIDLVDGYHHHDGHDGRGQVKAGPGSEPAQKKGDAASDDRDAAYASGILPAHVAVTQHVVLGVSLGGHSGWQLLFADERVTAGVLIIGCPDYIGMFHVVLFPVQRFIICVLGMLPLTALDLMVERARLSKLATYKAAAEGGPPFLGSRDFPAALVGSVLKRDPKGIVFGTNAAVWPSTAAGEKAVHDTLQKHVVGKQFLVCSGGADKLVPYKNGKSFLDVFKKAAATWPDLGLSVTDRIYDGIGHQFSSAMVVDAIQFVVETVADAPAADGAQSPKTSKI